MDLNNLDRDFFIFAQPVKTEVGEARFLSYFEYLQNIQELSLMKSNVLHLYYQYKKSLDAMQLNSKEREEANHFLSEYKKETLFNIVTNSEELLNAYEKIFNEVFGNEHSVGAIMSHEILFMQYRKLILDMNLLLEDEVSPNEEIQKGIEMGRLINNQKGEKQSFGDIVTSIVASTSNSFEDVCKMTIYQVYAIYARIGAIFNYQTSTLFATVSEQTIESWSRHIDLFDNGSGGTMKRSEFDKKFGKLL